MTQNSLTITIRTTQVFVELYAEEGSDKPMASLLRHLHEQGLVTVFEMAIGRIGGTRVDIPESERRLERDRAFAVVAGLVALWGIRSGFATRILSCQDPIRDGRWTLSAQGWERRV